MRYASTRGDGEVSFSEALAAGLAADGGLYVPTAWPSFTSRTAPATLPEVAASLLQPFIADDPLQPDLAAITEEAFSFPAPLVSLGDEPTQLLELFHGPTAAFKDFGARFVAACLSRARRERPLHILVATSGDTGGAVAAAFHKRPGVRVSVLFPKGLVSPAQERQLTCWDDNVRSLAVRGTFDDCQALVKAAFADKEMRSRYDLSSANSINVGRLLPQMTYFALTSLAIWNVHRAPASFVIPSGNLGHATACVWARRVGLPIGEIVLAHNRNRTMPDYLESGVWRPRASVATLASAMDVGDPSNGERLRHLFPDLAAMRGALTAYAIDDDAIRSRIRTGWEKYGQIWCPHTATAAEAHALHMARGGEGRWTIVATANPAKFPEIVEPLLGRTIPVPNSLAALFDRPSQVTEIEPDLSALRRAVA